MTTARDYTLTTTAILLTAIGFTIFATIGLAVYLTSEAVGWVCSPFIRTPRLLPARELAGRYATPMAAARLRTTGAR